MPRRNKPIKHTPYRPTNSEAAKKRYPSQAAAKKAAEERMLLQPQLHLTTYRALDGGWYLTRSRNSD